MTTAQTPHWTEQTMIVPRRREDVIEEPLDDEAVLFNPTDGGTLRLNKTAFVVWSACDGINTVHAIATRLTEEYEIELDAAIDHVEQLVARFADSRLLHVAD